MRFDGAFIQLTTRISKYLTVHKGDTFFKEIVNEQGEYAQCIACVDNGRMLIVERDGFDRQQPIIADDYNKWRVVWQTLDDGIPLSVIDILIFQN